MADAIARWGSNMTNHGPKHWLRAVGGVTALLVLVAAATAHAEAQPPAGSTSDTAGTTSAPDAPTDRAVPRAAPAEGTTAPAAPAEAPAPPGRVLPSGAQLRDPTDQDLRGLQILEEEFQRYMERARGFRMTVNTIVRREHERRRARLVEEYERQISAEEEMLTRARRRAIEEFEDFLRRYPNDPLYTPDAMFRLAELYYEDSYETFLDEADRYAELQERRDQGEDIELPPDPEKDFSRSVNLFRRLVAEYPDYRHLDGALYLLGFCLNETGDFEEARVAWLALACSNRFQYEGPVPRQEPGQAAETPDLDSLVLAPEEGGRQRFVNPYANCVPIVEESRFLEETWLRIGEYHFDYDFTPHGLDRAIAAYRQAMQNPESPFYDKALYKLAWSYYRANRYEDAIRHFAMLVEFADENLQRTGRTGSEMRPEAIQYLGISFTEDDWDNDHVPDTTRGIERLQNPSLLPQDAEYTSEVYFQTGDTYFDLARYNDAIQVYELALRRWPLHLEAPRVVERIAQCYERNREFEEAIGARARLRDYGLGSEWREANEMEHPEAVREAAQLARNALYDDAVRHHQVAQNLRQRAVEDENADLLQRARDEYALAAQGYRTYLEHYPNDPDAYEIGFNLAEAMFFSGRYREAATAYAEVRDSNLDDRFRDEAAFRTIKALEALRDAEVEAGTLQIPDEPPEPQGTPPQVASTPIPPILLELASARELHVQQLPESQRTPVFRYQTAQMYYRHGHWDEAKTRFASIYNDYCSDEAVAYYSWQNMVNMAGSLNQLDEAERLAQMQTERRCAPPVDADTAEAGPDGRPADPLGEAQQILTSARFRHAQEKFNQARAAEEANQPNAGQLYEESAEMFMAAVEGASDHPEAASAMNNAALAYEEVDRFESAMHVWRKIVEDYPDSEFVDVARFRLAYNAYRFFEYEDAVSHFKVLAQGSKSEEIRRDSILNTATILTNLQEYDKAAPYWRQYAEPGVAPDSKVRAEAAFRAAEMPYKSKNWVQAVRKLRGYMTEYRSMREAGPYRVRASYLVADVYKKQRQNREYFRALDGVIGEFQGSGEGPGSNAAEYAAEARFRIVDQDMDELQGIKIGGKAKTITKQIEDGARRVGELEKAYKTVTTYRRPEWTVAAHFRIGNAYEHLAKAMLDADLPTDTEQILIGGLPAEVRRELRRIPAAQRRELLRDQTDTLEQQWRDDMIKRVSGMEDRAIAEYELCARAAREGNIVNEYTRQANERLFAYRPEQYPLQREGRTNLELDSVTPPSPTMGTGPSPYATKREVAAPGGGG